MLAFIIFCVNGQQGREKSNGYQKVMDHPLLGLKLPAQGSNVKSAEICY